MNKLNVYELPVVANVCDQMLREVERSPDNRWSMAHVVMNPQASSLLHAHDAMWEFYIITRGVGELVCEKTVYSVMPGNIVGLKPSRPHMLNNISAGALEHLVIASPAFDPRDVRLVDTKEMTSLWDPLPHRLNKPEECFDGAKIISYDTQELGLSFAFGWVIADPKRHKAPHYHKKIHERVFIIEGEGAIELNGVETPLKAGDWLHIEPLERHALRNTKDRYMVALCMCDPQFEMDDVYFD